MEIAAISSENAEKDHNRLKQLIEKGLISEKDFDASQKEYQEAKLRLDMAQEKLALLEKGKIKIADTNIETIIKSPTSGYILEKMTDVGDPIVPLTSYQAGTVIFTIADMSKLLFKFILIQRFYIIWRTPFIYIHIIFIVQNSQDSNPILPFIIWHIPNSCQKNQCNYILFVVKIKIKILFSFFVKLESAILKESKPSIITVRIWICSINYIIRNLF